MLVLDECHHAVRGVSSAYRIIMELFYHGQGGGDGGGAGSGHGNGSGDGGGGAGRGVGGGPAQGAPRGQPGRLGPWAAAVQGRPPPPAPADMSQHRPLVLGLTASPTQPQELQLVLNALVATPTDRSA